MARKFIVQSLINGGDPVSAPRVYTLATEDDAEDVFTAGYLNDLTDQFKAHDVAFLVYSVGTVNETAVQVYVELDGDDNLNFVVGVLGAPGPLSLKGSWNASTNTPTLPNPPAEGTQGDFYVVTVAGTQFGISFGVGDWIISDAESGTWFKQANSSAALALAQDKIFQGNGSGIATQYSVSGDIAMVAGVTAISAGVIVNADISASAAIAYSKLNLASSIVNADVSNSAAIAYSKLNLTGNIVNADISASAGIVYSKLTLTGAILNADINASAAIAYSKLNLASSIVNADINASAAIAYSKLALTNSILNADINASAAIAYSKLNLASSIVNADISASAGIDLSKLAATTASRALVSDGSGFVTAATTTSTEIGYVNGVTSSIQTQIDLKAPLASPTFSGTVTANADLKLNTAGNGLYIKEGANATMGVSTLTAGTVTVNTTKVTASSRVFLTRQSKGASATTLGLISLGTVVPSTSFVIDALDETTGNVDTNDVSVVAWMIVEPA